MHIVRLLNTTLDLVNTDISVDHSISILPQYFLLSLKSYLVTLQYA